MNKPTKLAFSDYVSLHLGRGIVFLLFLITAYGFFLTLVTTDTTLIELALPCAGASALIFILVGILIIVALGHRIVETHLINRMFAGEIWEYWQFRSAEWQAIVEADCNLISPKDEGLKAYQGVVYSSIFGVLLAIILIAVGIFAIKDPEIKVAIWITSVALFLLMVGIGIFQPIIARYDANRYRRKALCVAAPRVWFASDGVYHETLGHTSLKELIKVTDQTRSRKAIKFTLSVSTDTSTNLVQFPVHVPKGYEERAGKLVRRYRQERLQKGSS